MFQELVQQCRFVLESHGDRLKAAKLHTRSASGHEDALAGKKFSDIGQADHYAAAHHHGRARDAWWSVAKSHPDSGLRHKAGKMGDWHDGQYKHHSKHAQIKSFSGQELGTSDRARKSLYGRGRKIKRSEMPRSR